VKLARVTDLPSGTVTFLFTDIEGSTRLAQAKGGSWPAILDRHNALVAGAIEAAGGRVFGTEGDAVFAVFTSAPRSVEGAAAAQRALAAEAWPDEVVVRVRMGIHTGDGALGGDSYVGVDVHRVARIANAGHGGQVLLSAATRMLVEASLPEGVTIRDLGEHRLKDLSRPELLSMLVLDGLADTFPPLRTVDAVPNNLPTQLTTFLGRDVELARAAMLLGDARLLTLTGPGGTGKTRLSLQLAADSTDAYRDGVYFVPLGTIEEPALVLPTIAQALGLPDLGRRPVERLAEQLAGKRLLLVLDNFEQVIDAAPVVADLLGRLPEMRVLATSRSPLRIYGEQEFPVPPLALPDPRHLPDVETFSQFASVALFIERAMAVRPDFRVDASNAPAIAEICVQLDGLPLAIELAAARVRVLPPQAILSRLSDRLSLLSGGSRDLPERQQTLRGAIEWSHDLLEPVDQTVFARFSVFAGGADLEAAEAIVLADWPAEAGPMPDALDALSSMVDKSLIRQEVEPSGNPRFRMLETIRAYAAERLAGAEPDLATRDRHARYYASMAEAAAAELFGERQRELLDGMEVEHDNVRAAIGFALERNDAELGLRLLSACWRFWQMRGYLPEGRERAERILTIPGVEAHPQLRLRALDAAGGIAYWQGDQEVARSWYLAERDQAAALGDAPAEAEAIYNAAMTLSTSGINIVEARSLAQDAVQRFRDLGDRHGVARALWGEVNTYLFDAAMEAARPLNDEAVAIFREVGDRFMLAWALFSGALIDSQAHRPDAARAALVEALTIFRETEDLSGYALVIDGFGTLEYLIGDHRRAMTLAGAASAIQDVSGVGLADVNRAAADFSPKDLMSDPELAAAYAAGQRLSAQQAVRLALGEDPLPDPGSPPAV
jgi:predicted ATPase/class 3 adenylate cyclase